MKPVKLNIESQSEAVRRGKSQELLIKDGEY